MVFIAALFGALLPAAAVLAAHGIMRIFGEGGTSLLTPGLYAFSVTALLGTIVWGVIPFFRKREKALVFAGASLLGASTVFSALMFACGGPSFAADPKIFRIWSVALALFAALAGAVRINQPLAGPPWGFLKTIVGLYACYFLPAAGLFIGMVALSDGWQVGVGAILLILCTSAIKGLGREDRPRP